MYLVLIDECHDWRRRLLMGKWREEIKVLPCGCKIGKSSSNGLWFYDYICDTHLPNFQKRKKYCYEKALKMTEKLNKESAEEDLELTKEYENCNEDIEEEEDKIRKLKHKSIRIQGKYKARGKEKRREP